MPSFRMSHLVYAIGIQRYSEGTSDEGRAVAGTAL